MERGALYVQRKEGRLDFNFWFCVCVCAQIRVCVRKKGKSEPLKREAKMCIIRLFDLFACACGSLGRWDSG